MRNKIDLQSKKLEFISDFQNNFYPFIAGKIATPASDAKMGNEPRAVINAGVNQAKAAIRGNETLPGIDLTRILDQMPYTVLTPEEAQSLTPDELGAFLRECHDAVSSFIFNNTKTGINEQLIQAIGENEYYMMQKAIGGKDTLLAESFLKAVYISYPQKLLDLFKDRGATRDEGIEFQNKVMMPLERLTKEDFPKVLNQEQLQYLSESITNFFEDFRLKVPGSLETANGCLEESGLQYDQQVNAMECMLPKASENLYLAYKELEKIRQVHPSEQKSEQRKIDQLDAEVTMLGETLKTLKSNKKYKKFITPEKRTALEQIVNQIKGLDALFIDDFHTEPPNLPLSTATKLDLTTHAWFNIVREVQTISSELYKKPSWQPNFVKIDSPINRIRATLESQLKLINTRIAHDMSKPPNEDKEVKQGEALSPQGAKVSNT